MRSLSKAQALDFLAAHAAILDGAANPVDPFASSEWLAHFVEQVVRDDERLVVAHDAAHGGSLLMAGHDPGAPDRCRSVANYYASLSSPFASAASLPADRDAAVRRLVGQLTTARPRIATLHLAPLDAESRDTATLQDELRRQGWHVRPYVAFGNWTLPCDGLAWADYLATRDSRLRNTLARKSKKLLAAGRVEILRDVADVERGMDAYDAIYARSWKQPEPYPDFVRGWARRCARRGWLRLGIAWVGDEPVAAQFWFTIARRASIFKLAYDDAQARWSAGSVLSAALFREALDVDRVVEIDYLTGDDPYKRAWMTHRRERIGLMASHLRTVTGALNAARELAGSLTAPLRSRLRGVPLAVAPETRDETEAA